MAFSPGCHWHSMKPIDFESLQRAVDHPHPGSRDILFAGLASSRAAWRTRAAEGLLKQGDAERADDRALAQSFGKSADAIFSPAMEELRQRIGIPATEAWTTFSASTVLNYDSWHDGLGFDLDALARMPAFERDLIRQWLRTRLEDRLRDVDLRDLEAAAALGETELLASLRRHPEPDVRLRARELLAAPGDVAEELCHTLSQSRSEDAVLRALDLVSSHATAEVRAALIERVSRVDGTFINSAMVLLEVFGGVADAWSERPFLFEVQRRGKGGELLQQLLARVGQTVP
jgi:hypothetical protein